MARLVANLPVLKLGYPPNLIDLTRRRDYLHCLSAYDLQVGPAQAGKALLPESALRDTFQKICQGCWQASLDLVAEMKERQQVRSNERR
ncbi:MAG: hypothetical protein WCP96_11705 [Methylococcaceae bacterium]